MVGDVKELPEGLSKVTIPAHKYCKIECGPGSLFEIKVNVWKWLNEAKSEELGGLRNEIYDFEVYSETHKEIENTKFDLHIGLKNWVNI